MSIWRVDGYNYDCNRVPIKKFNTEEEALMFAILGRYDDPKYYLFKLLSEKDKKRALEMSESDNPDIEENKILVNKAIKLFIKDYKKFYNKEQDIYEGKIMKTFYEEDQNRGVHITKMPGTPTTPFNKKKKLKELYSDPEWSW
jgi:hypothetical protein